MILSARARNLVSCVEALRKCEPELSRDRIVVVDDGARAGAKAEVGELTWVRGIEPFVFARNANLGIRACKGDVILLNDDAQLITPWGFSAWSELLAARPEIGICSAGIRGRVGNPRQKAATQPRLKLELAALAFVCVYLRRQALDAVGPLDERFVGYGCEDTDYCDRTLSAGWSLAVWHGCIVEHSIAIAPTFCRRRNLQRLAEKNRRLYAQKRASSLEAPREPPRSAGLRLNIAWRQGLTKRSRSRFRWIRRCRPR